MITAATRLVGLIGDPVSHSLSPAMQNAAFAAAGLDWAYVPLPVAHDRLGAALAGLVALSFAGANVTIPHKNTVAALCDALTDIAQTSGSVNTLIVTETGAVVGDSTDGEAVVSGVRDAAGVETLAGDALVLGAGGSARAVAAALIDAGLRVTITARRRHQAAALADALGASAAERLPRSLPALVVNCTPLGSASALTETPVPADSLNGVRCVCDLAYRPDRRPTLLIQQAASRGVTVVDGREVLVRQGAASFRRWTGIDAPLGVMRSAVAG